MVSVNPNPAQGFYYYDPMKACLPGLNSLPPANTAPTSTASTSGSQMPACLDDPYYKKIRKPYTITKSRESWTEQEHDKFLEALQLFDRDWKKIEAFIGSKTVIQIRSHAQKYFLKVQKNGTNEHVPPPRPKRKAAHPYPQKAPKHAAISNVSGPTQSSSVLHERAYVCRPDSSSALGTPASGAAISSWSFDSVPPVPVAHMIKDDAATLRPAVLYDGCYSSSNGSAPRTWQSGDTAEQGDQIKPQRVMPDFAKVYHFIGSIFDPKASGHLERLKQLDPIDTETVLLLLRNLSFNLSSPEFEKHRKMLSAYHVETENPKPCSYDNMHAVKAESAIASM